MEDQNKSGTFVDLGEDLLGNSSVTVQVELPKIEIEVPPQAAAPPPPQQPLSNTVELSSLPLSIQTEPDTPDRIVEDARILLEESLVEEAKKKLFQVLRADPTHLSAVALLSEIRAREVDELKHEGAAPDRRKHARPLESSIAVLRQLEKDFGLGVEATASQREVFQVSTQGAMHGLDRFDLMIAFFEMDCPADALREARRIERDLLISQSDLGIHGLVLKEIEGRCLLALGQAFEAQLVVVEALQVAEYDLKQKLSLMVLAAEIEESLENVSGALGWYTRVLQADVTYRDIAQRYKVLRKSDASKKN